MKIEYVARRFSAESIAIIERAEAICDDYAAQGYDLTLRQLYYQFVARGYIANRQTEYKRLGSIVNDARLAGLIDWDHLVDRTRNLQTLSRWRSPSDIMQTVARQYDIDRWQGQDTRVEVWVEKEALAGVVERAANEFQVPWFSCRGYVSQSELWGASQRLLGHLQSGTERIVVLHLGDHDPSGIDMTRDIRERLNLFVSPEGYSAGVGYGDDIRVLRIALNMDQVQQYQPPPNPAKLTDSRVGGYLRRFGDESWELDALDPATLNALISDHIEAIVDRPTYDERIKTRDEARMQLTAISRRWQDVTRYIGGEA